MLVVQGTIINSLRPSDAYVRRYKYQHWFRYWLVAWTAPSHYLNQCWNIVNWTLRNKLQWNYSRNYNIFFKKDAVENVFCVIASISSRPQWVNTLRPEQNGGHFAASIFKCIFLNENIWISITLSLYFVPKGWINNIPSLVQIMAWRTQGDKPLSEPMMIILLMHRPQWVQRHHPYTS